MRVENEIFEMLTENTGSHFLDSGNAYGRHHERNVKKTLKDFENEPSVTFEVWGESIDYTINVFHYLVSQLELDDICEGFNNLNTNADDWEAENFYGVSREAENYLLENYEIELFGESVNSYNHETNLSQVIQYRNFTILGEHYIIIQLHNGCDVRGGYTNAKLFKLDNEYCYDGGYLAPESVYGVVDGVQCDNGYNGYSITNEEGEEVEVNENSEIDLQLIL